MASSFQQSSKAASWASDDRFPDPFADMASLAMPESMADALEWSEYIILANGTYRSAISRVISYFITDIEISATGGGGGEDRVGREEKQKYLDFLNDTLGIKEVLSTVALDYMVYGNSFTSLIMPFRRYLSCPVGGCGLELPLKKIYNTPEFGFTWTDFQFHATCPHCGYRGVWRHVDRRSGESGQLRVKRWSPHELDILHDSTTDDSAFIWKIPDDERQKIKKGHLFNLERTSWEIVEAIKNDQALLFDPEVVYHMKEQPLAGVRTRGWGFSRVLTNFRQAWYYQVLQRYNESIALDYIIPFRVITPQARSGEGGAVNDPLSSLNMGDFNSRVASMIKQRRQDPARWNILPFAVEYQALGGEASQLAPSELLELGMDTLLNSIGVPVELYRGSLTVQSAPAALRLFEANWSHLVHNLNRFLTKLVDKIAKLMSWEPVVCRLQRVTHADDLNRQMAMLQLMMGGQISRTTGLASVGAEFAEEERRKLEEEQITAEAVQEAQEEMEQAALMDEMAVPPPPPGASPPGGAMPPGAAPPGGAMPPGAAPAAPGAPAAFAAGNPPTPNQPTTPEEMQSMATTLAQQAMAMPESQKDSFLIQLKKEDPTIHALVTSQIEDMRRQAKNVGGAAVMQQQFGKAAVIQSRALREILLD